jgi:hypothetical protein
LNSNHPYEAKVLLSDGSDLEFPNPNGYHVEDEWLDSELINGIEFTTPHPKFC